MPTSILNNASVFQVSINGRNGNGPISVPGTRIGDLLIVYIGGSLTQQGSSDPFEFVVSVDDEIQQQFNSGNLSTTTYNVFLLRTIK